MFFLSETTTSKYIQMSPLAIFLTLFFSFEFSKIGLFNLFDSQFSSLQLQIMSESMSNAFKFIECPHSILTYPFEFLNAFNFLKRMQKTRKEQGKTSII